MAKKKGIGRFVLVSLLALGTVGAVTVGIKKGADAFTESGYFKVKSVNVKGLIKADGNKVETMVKSMVGQSIFDVKPETIDYSGDSWVERMEIRKVFPDRLDVVVFEKRPVFKLQYTRGCFTATSTGLMIKDTCEGVRIKMEQQVKEEDFKEFIKMYEKAAVLKDKNINLKQFYFTMVENGIELRASYNQADFERMYATYQDIIRKRYKEIEYVDMRIPDKIFVKGVM
ncbi:cell division protein FtsQ/DivIB [Seleniivibrio woodruffii]|uniref:cell division protein FtsQ/DivIB n=1 Tax=Seleniivibrio woodruffii TaxID=1078050 RepID=UPI0026F11AB7|nr:FtsQ-type POTRA domain-containing protein [Seleniivibrio woodruffii]